jgi:hypothetical protein
MASENLRRLVKRTKQPVPTAKAAKELVIQDVVECPTAASSGARCVSDNLDVDVTGDDEEEEEARFDCSLVSIPFFFLFCARISGGDPDSDKSPSRTPPSDPPSSDSPPKHII